MRPSGTRDGVWATSGLAFVALFLGGLVAADVLTGRPYPGIDEPVAQIGAYFSESGAEVRALSFLHSLAAVSLLAFAAYLRTVLGRGEREGSPLGALLSASGAMAATFLLLSALLFWALARPATAADHDVARALFDLSYLAGGLGLLLSLAAFIGASAVLALRTRLLPLWIARAGVATAVVSLLAAPTLLAERGAFGPGGVIVTAALPAFLWITAASIALGRSPRPRSRRASSASPPGHDDLPLHEDGPRPVHRVDEAVQR